MTMTGAPPMRDPIGNLFYETRHNIARVRIAHIK